jgi:purine-binding chemotaxis protein CheW
MGSKCRLCTFRLQHLWFGIVVEKVQEVISPPTITSVPLASRGVAGLVNLRGQIVTVLDLGRRLDFPERLAAVWPAMVVVRSENVVLGLLVDEMGEVVEAPEEACEAAPSNLLSKCRELLPRVCKFPGRLLPVLDLDRILQRDDEAYFRES